MHNFENRHEQTMLRKIIHVITVVVAIMAGQGLSAQSKDFKLGQWSEIHSSIIRELNRSYVDTLPVDKLFRAGIDAMLVKLDPYTVYIP